MAQYWPTLLHLSSTRHIGANYHHPLELPDTSGLNRGDVNYCLESVYPRSRTQLDTESVPPPSNTEETSETPQMESYHWLIDFNVLLTSTLSSLHLPLPSPCSASPPAPSLLEVVSPSPSPAMPSTYIKPQDLQPQSVPERIDPVAPALASDRLGPSICRLHLGSSPLQLPPPDTLGLTAPPGSLVPPAPPWSVVTPPSPRTCGPSARLCSSTPTAAAGSSFIFRSASVLHHNDIFSVLGYSDPQIIVATTSPRPPVPEMSLFSIGSPSAPWNQLAPPPSVVPQLMPASTPHWLLPPSTPP
ncbi:hypothetical protein DPX16_11051 [Anabarilius grahami]|uniref:Uncharacterized protein n=1 Tax=Anabarilius grahami TaxID=495550 RepID=A0A3N0Y2X6_ANAGA|nr:hypothetical protein DPX16_11051 [Anabarilius grahami]